MRFSCLVYHLLIGTLLVSSCSTGRKINRASDADLSKSSPYVVKRLASHQHVEFQDLNARAKVKYDDGEQRISFITQLRMKKGEYIWIQASFLSYEVARILIRPDSIFAINRIEKTYLSEKYESFNHSYEIPATYQELEALLLGNTVIDLEQPFDFAADSQYYQVRQQRNTVDLAESIDPVAFCTTKVQVTDQKSNYSIKASYEDFRNGLKSKKFSYFRQYIIDKDNVQVASIQLNFTDIDTNSKNAPFEIPAHYVRTD